MLKSFEVACNEGSLEIAMLLADWFSLGIESVRISGAFTSACHGNSVGVAAWLTQRYSLEVGDAREVYRATDIKLGELIERWLRVQFGVSRATVFESRRCAGCGRGMTFCTCECSNSDSDGGNEDDRQ